MNETLCECGHDRNMHEPDGCTVVVSDAWAPGGPICKCFGFAREEQGHDTGPSAEPETATRQP